MLWRERVQHRAGHVLRDFSVCAGSVLQCVAVCCSVFVLGIVLRDFSEGIPQHPQQACGVLMFLWCVDLWESLSTLSRLVVC